MRELDLGDFAAYRNLLETHAEEWGTLDGMCRITISRFCRDKAVFEVLASTVLPELAKLTPRLSALADLLVYSLAADPQIGVF